MGKGDKSFEFQSRLPGGTLSPVLSPHVGGRVLVCSLCYGERCKPLETKVSEYGGCSLWALVQANVSAPQFLSGTFVDGC